MTGKSLLAVMSCDTSEAYQKNIFPGRSQGTGATVAESSS